MLKIQYLAVLFSNEEKQIFKSSWIGSLHVLFMNLIAKKPLLMPINASKESNLFFTTTCFLPHQPKYPFPNIQLNKGQVSWKPTYMKRRRAGFLGRGDYTTKECRQNRIPNSNGILTKTCKTWYISKSASKSSSNT